MQTLVVTVGGSSEPVVNAVRELEPDQVVFICSAGTRGSRRMVDAEGRPCQVFARAEPLEPRPSLVAQLGLGGRFDPARHVVEVENPDDPAECYAAAADLLERLGSEPGHEVVVDYTGGTKTMSFALATAAVDHKVKVYLTTRQRDTLQAVRSDSYTDLVDISPIQVRRLLDKVVPRMFGAFDYQGASQVLKEVGQEVELRGGLRDRVLVARDLARAFEAWDRFDHAEARRNLQRHTRLARVRPLVKRLDRVLACRQLFDPAVEPGRREVFHGYELVEDLILNARRRVAQGRYDDAVGRIYRALELLAQVRLLRAYELKTGALPPEAVPEAVRAEVLAGEPEGVLKVGLYKAFTILGGFPQDPVGDRFKQARGRLKAALETRNASLFAHGFSPLDREAWERFQEVVVAFLEACLDALRPPEESTLEQLPGDLRGLSQGEGD